MTRSIRTRLTLAIIALAAAVAATVLGGLYWATLNALDREAKESIRVELGALVDHWQEHGLPGLVAEVERRSVEKDGHGYAYLVAKESRYRVAGNIQKWPDDHSPNDDERVPIKLRKPGREADIWMLKHVHLESVKLGDHHLLVGRDTTLHEPLIEALKSAALLSLGLTALLAVAAGLAVGRGLLGRVETMRSKISEIVAGARSERVAVGQSGDEFDELATQFNGLLDENERLLLQVREATNNIAHDLRTPLQRMHSRLESALASPSEAASMPLLEALSADTDRLLETFNGLLQIARVEADEIRKNMQPTALGTLLVDIEDLYEPLAEEVGLTLQIDAEPELHVLAERQLLGQAIANLVDNAIKYAADGDSITIDARRKDDRIVISVADHGPGIPKADRTRVLERLVRLDRSRTVPGSGLGLSFVAAVARLHGCDLELRDNEPGLRVELSLRAAQPIPR